MFRVALLFLVLFSVSAQAKSIKDYQPYNYDVRFTNPICDNYIYETEVHSQSGKPLLQKPKNVYCKPSDEEANTGRAGSPSEKILDWIKDKKTSEIFMTYLSFSNNDVSEALCTAMQTRGLKVHLVLDSGTGLTKAKSLEECSADNFTLYLRGHVPGLDYAHNKLFVVNPFATDTEFKFAFGSGNMTSGLVLHHENWHFITTNRQSYLAQAQVCLMNAEIKNAESANDFRTAMASCLQAIGIAPEDDIKPFFVPGQGDQAFQAIEEALSWATHVDIAAHRFSYTSLIKALSEKLSADSQFQLRLVLDDDIFYVNRPNTGYEKGKLLGLQRLGAQPRYMQTNNKSFLLHHNKFIVFKGPNNQKALFTGAGNFTGTAFSRNWENFFMITIAEVVDKVDAQYTHLYNDLATAEADLPSENINP